LAPKWPKQFKQVRHLNLGRHQCRACLPGDHRPGKARAATTNAKALHPIQLPNRQSAQHSLLANKIFATRAIFQPQIRVILIRN